MTEMYSLRDVATHVREQYRQRKKNSKKSRLFVEIEEEAYVVWGKQFGYTDSHTFKSDLTRLINKMRKESNNGFDEEEIEVIKKLNKIKKKSFIGGISCFDFTSFQINNLQLNPDSYL